MKRRWLLVFLPVALGLVIVFAARSWLQIAKLQIPLDELIFWIGLILSVAVAVIIVLWNRRDNLLTERQSLEESLDRAIVKHQQFAEETQSRQQNLEESLKKVNEEHLSFQCNLDHALRNPLTAISMGLENLNGVYDAGALERLKTDVERVISLVKSLRKLADHEAGPIDRTWFELETVLHETVRVTRDKPGASRRELKLELPKAPLSLPKCFGDEKLIYIAILNLLDNAIKFTEPDTGTVRILVTVIGRKIFVQIVDNGIGIPIDEIDKIWQPFFRGQAAKDRCIPGSGIGLPQTRAIIEQHGWQISVEDLGKGTAFTIYLPAGDVTNL